MQEVVAATSEHKDETIKSREIDLSAATPSKRRSKKKSEATALPAEAQIKTAEVSPGLNMKLVLGVALVSIIFGIIVGKRY